MRAKSGDCGRHLTDRLGRSQSDGLKKGKPMKRYIMTYGVACVKTKGGKSEVVKSIPDVTSDQRIAQRIVDICNENDLSVEHLSDVIEDVINE